MPDEPIIAVSKVSQKGVVQIPFEVRQRLDLKPGTRLIVVAAEDTVILQRADVLVAKQASKGIIQKLRSIFSKLPIRDIEE